MQEHNKDISKENIFGAKIQILTNSQVFKS